MSIKDIVELMWKKNKKGSKGEISEFIMMGLDVCCEFINN